MMFKGKNVYNASFNTFAENYHSVRPAYPQEVYEDIKLLCDINNTSNLLEIGAGSGIATIELAKLEGKILAIEPGTKLIEIAKQQTKEFPNVKILEGTFENFQSETQFDAILAFTAYHWIDEGIKYQKVSKLLKELGNLILVWNSFFLSDSNVNSEVIKSYQKFFPDLYSNQGNVSDVNEVVLSKLHKREQEIVEHSEFYTVAIRKYLTVYSYNSNTYPKFISTFPKIIELEDTKRTKFLKKISEVVSKYQTISVPVLTTLIICKKRSGFLKAISHEEGG